MQDCSQIKTEEQSKDIKLDSIRKSLHKNGECCGYCECCEGYESHENCESYECCGFCGVSDDFTDDTIMNGRILIRQPKKGYRVAMDPIVLASQVNLQQNQSVLDVGSGVGAISLILKSRVPSASVTSVDIDPKMCDLCRYNALKNGLNLDIHNASIEDFCVSNSGQQKEELNQGEGCKEEEHKGGKCKVQSQGHQEQHDTKSSHLKQYDHVVTNPPFFKKESSRISKTKIMANFETIELSVWIHLCLNLLKPHGTFSIIHEPSRIAEILAAIEGRAGSISIFPVYSNEYSDKAVRIIVQGIKGNRGGTKVMKGIFTSVSHPFLSNN